MMERIKMNVHQIQYTDISFPLAYTIPFCFKYAHSKGYPTCELQGCMNHTNTS
uniref:Uncharacterized protein n=1 Tax=Anguilla anguilla TaxID=7936 RepID=A0A0E9XJD3_ANGAN